MLCAARAMAGADTMVAMPNKAMMDWRVIFVPLCLSGFFARDYLLSEQCSHAFGRRAFVAIH